MRKLNQSDVGKIFNNGNGDDIKIIFISKNRNIAHPVVGVMIKNQIPEGYAINGEYWHEEDKYRIRDIIISPKFTINSKVRTRYGRPARIICDDLIGRFGCTILTLIMDDELGEEIAYACYEDGSFTKKGEHDFDLIEITEE